VSRPTLGWVVAALALAPLRPGSVSAQAMRGWVGSTLQMVELRPVEAIGGSCAIGSDCYRTLAEERSYAATQDLSLTAWGLGVRGLSATLLARSRARLGSDVVWPRTDDQFDALLAYAQLVRGPLTLRAGRQEIRSGLGFPSFDGASATLTSGGVRVEAYGGRSLARGLRDPVNEALRGIESFVPDQSVYLFGGATRARFSTTSLTARYQREILSDRSGLASERGSLDLSTVVPGARVTGSLDYDFGFERVGKGHLTVSVPLSSGHWIVEASTRRYVPYFSLSTIWGFFEPVSYREARVRVGWSPSKSFAAWTQGGLRRYGDTKTTVVLQPLSDNGRRAEAGLRWQATPEWGVDGSYRLEWGPGGYLSSGDASVRWTPREGASIVASATSFQQIEQYRLGDGRAVGGGLSFNFDLSDRASLAGGMSVLRHRGGGGASDSAWNQSRGWSSVRLRMGRDPGLANRRSR
jgi:hypothetical protein